MNSLTTRLKKIRLGQVLTAFLAGIVLLIGTACSSTDVLAAKTADQIREEVPSGMVTSQFKGGMNDYADTDPRNPNVSAAKAKAQLLVENAQQRINNKASNNVPENIRRVADEGPDKLNQIGQKLDEDTRAAQRNAREFGENAQQGIANIQENTRKGVRDAKGVVKEATTGAQKKADDATGSLTSKISQGLNQAKHNANEAVEDVID